MQADAHAEALDAGHRALARGAWAMARLRFVELLADEEGVEALEGLGVAARYQLDAAGAFDAHERGLELAGGDRAVAARLAAQLAYDAHTFRGDAETRDWLDRAAELTEGGPPTAATAFVPMLRAQLALLSDHDPGAALDLSERAVELARAAEAVDLALRSLALNGLARVACGDVEAGMSQLDDAVDSALDGELTDVDTVESTCCFAVEARRRVRDLEGAELWCERVLDFATRYDDQRMFSLCRTYRADVLMWRGDWDEADAELTAAIGELGPMRPGLEAGAVCRLAELRRRQGRTEAAERLAATAGEHRLRPLVEGRLALDLGNAANAHAAAARALELVGAADRFARVEGLELAVRAGVAAGELGDARAAARELGELAELAPDTPLRAAAHLAAGRVAAAGGAPSEAQPLLEEAVAAYEAAGAPFETAVARAELGAVLRAGGRTRLAARAEAQAQAALDELGARPPSSRPGGLSEREAEVLELLVRGASNDDIARELKLSVRTVERHTANLYAKVGASGRSARAMATAWAHSHGIG